MRFTARTQAGSGRGKNLSVPTVNVSLDDVPRELKEGIYACLVHTADTSYHGAMHYGPRPVFNDTASCEVHLIDQVFDNVPTEIDIETVERIRDVQNFDDAEKLTEQMLSDIAKIRDILGIS